MSTSIVEFLAYESKFAEIVELKLYIIFFRVKIVFFVNFNFRPREVKRIVQRNLRRVKNSTNGIVFIWS